MIRVDDWQKNLTELIEAKRNVPYSITDHNCLMWALSGALAVNGVDYYKQFRGKFKTEKGAAKALRQIGKASSSVEFLEATFGKRNPLAFARKGDIVAAVNPQGQAELANNLALFGPPVGVCYGLLSYFVGLDGLITIETLKLGSNSYGFYC